MGLIKGLVSIVLSFIMGLGLWTPESLEIANVPEKAEGDVRVISFNVRCKDDDYGSVKTRSQLIVSALKQYHPDSFGVQEATEEWIDILTENLDEYACVCEFRGDGSMDEASAVFYLKDKYDVLDSGTIWLSRTPEVKGSKFLTSSIARIATWAVLQNKETKEVYTHINTHLDHIAELARYLQVGVLSEKVNELKANGTVVCTGDFNSAEGDWAYRRMAKTLKDSKHLAKESDSGLTFHNYGRNTTETRPIDFVFVSEGTEVSRYKIIDEQISGMYLSDHSGICVDMKI